MHRFHLVFSVFFLACSWLGLAQAKPNVVIVITDDQGYGDLACHGNPIIKTPHIDKFHSEAIRLTNYHVDPTCAPTRSALMTGRYSDRVGVWHTIEGRNFLRERETTMADVFKANDYATGLFGKWHLGDNYPYRPSERGFDHSVMHMAGGVGQAPDYWGNDYFDDIYKVNNVPKQFKGFCTDVWFDEAIKFMKKSKSKGKLFFSYITTNAPHGPFRAPKKYRDMYPEQDNKVGNFYGMITNIDDNFAKLRKFLEAEGLAENTILVFTTDNGSSAGSGVFNAGMSGKKGSNAEGGHRVPFFISWPAGKIGGGKDVDQLTAHMDILPSLIDLLGLKTAAKQLPFDGSSLKSLLHGDKEALRGRKLLVESQRIVDPKKWKNCAVMQDQWRLRSGLQLTDLKTDPAQKKRIEKKYPEKAAELEKFYEQWWADVSKEHPLYSYIHVGNKEENPLVLSSHDLLGGSNWNQTGVVFKATKDAPWAVKVEKAGQYQISIRRWPAELDLGINEEHQKSFVPNSTKAYLEFADTKLELVFAKDAKEVTFKLNLPAGLIKLKTGFILPSGKRNSATYVYILNEELYEKDLSTWQTREGMGLVKAETSKLYPFKDYSKSKKKKKSKH